MPRRDPAPEEAMREIAAKTEIDDELPHLDPLALRFADLHRWVTELEAFGDDPKASTEAKLEASQTAWYGEWEEAHE